MLVLIFFLGCHTAADMALGFVDIEYLSGFFCQSRIDLHHAQCDGGHDGNRHRDRSASSRIAVIASVIHSQTTPSLRHLFTIRTIWIATKHLMTVHTAAGKPQPLCSIGFHSDLANTAWNEIGT